MVEVKEYTTLELGQEKWYEHESFWPTRCGFTGVWSGFNEVYYTYNLSRKRACYLFVCQNVTQYRVNEARKQKDKEAQNKKDAESLAEHCRTKYFKITSKYDKDVCKTVYDLQYEPIGTKGWYHNKIEFVSLQEAEDAVEEIKATQTFKEIYHGKAI